MGNVFKSKKKKPVPTGDASNDEHAAAGNNNNGSKPKKSGNGGKTNTPPAANESATSSTSHSEERQPAKTTNGDTNGTKKQAKKANKADDISDDENPSSNAPAKASSSSDSEGKDENNSKGANEDFGTTIVKAQKQRVSKEDFDLLTVIGRGSFGKVMQVRHKKDGKIYAMKVMRKDAIIAKNQVTHTRDEKNILQSIHHPFIVNLNYAFQTKDKLYMILDYVNGGELFYHLKREGKFSEERVRMYAAEISSALLHLHAHGIIYRDLKPENILLDRDGHIVITDFGLSKEVPKDDATHTFCGTPEYLAPEVLKVQGHSFPVDWWSLGTLIYEMLTGLPPFYSKHINVMYQKILNAQLSFPTFMSENAKSLLEGLLDRDPEARLGGPAVRKHPFFSGIDWTALDAKQTTAPWIPPVRDAMDTTQIDDYFTGERPTDSYVDSTMMTELDEQDKDIFSGFTFAGDGPLAGNE